MSLFPYLTSAQASLDTQPRSFGHCPDVDYSRASLPFVKMAGSMELLSGKVSTKWNKLWKQIT